MDWIENYRKERIEKGIAKYGKWDPKSFKALKRDSLQEAIDEGIDLINYLEMAYMEGKISKGFLEKQRIEMKEILGKIEHIKFIS